MVDFVETLEDWQKYGAVAAIVLLIVGGFYYLSYKEKAAQIARLEEENAQLDSRILEAQATAARLEEFRKELAMVRAQLKSTVDILPHEEDMDKLISAIQGLAAQSGLSLETFTPRGIRRHGFYAEVPIEIDATGRYHEFGEFFEEIANEQRIVNAGDIIMSATNNPEESVKTSFTARAFFFEPEEVESATAPEDNRKGKRRRRR